MARLTCPSQRISKVLNFILDTGSEASFLGWQDSSEAGIEVDGLPNSRKPVLGFGGAAEAKHLNEPCFLHVDLDGIRLETVELSNGILIYRPSRTRSRHWKEGPSVSILGRDFLASSGMRLVVDLSHDEMYLEKV